MKELPATLVMRPFNFDTLATQAYTLAKDERLAEAALPSLAIVAVGVLPLLLLARAVRPRTSRAAPRCDDDGPARARARGPPRRRATVTSPRESYFQPARSRSFCAAGVLAPASRSAACRP